MPDVKAGHDDDTVLISEILKTAGILSSLMTQPLYKPTYPWKCYCILQKRSYINKSNGFIYEDKAHLIDPCSSILFSVSVQIPDWQSIKYLHAYIKTLIIISDPLLPL
ncbi:hypothetical protein FHS10_000355 [Mucilaginibacter dorajii]|nr:hypothetical protein [Mucilaginibacter dorajii]